MLPYEIDAPALEMLLKQQKNTVEQKNTAQQKNTADGRAARPKLVLLDVREPWEYATAHVEGSVLMPMGEVAGRVHQEVDPGSHIVALCHAGMRSMDVAVWLRNQGFRQTQSLKGGIDAWSRLVDPKVPRY